MSKKIYTIKKIIIKKFRKLKKKMNEEVEEEGVEEKNSNNMINFKIKI